MIKLKFLWTPIIPYSACSAPSFISFPFLSKPANVFGSQRFIFKEQVCGAKVPAPSLVSDHILTVSLAFCLESTKARFCGGGFFCCFCSLIKDLTYATVKPEDSPVACSREEYPTQSSGTDMHDYSGLPEAGRFLSAKRSASFRPAELPCHFIKKVCNISRNNLQPSDIHNHT